MSTYSQPQLEPRGAIGTDSRPIGMGDEAPPPRRPYKPAPFIPPPRNLHAEMANDFTIELPPRPEKAPKANEWATPKSVKRDGKIVARIKDGEWVAEPGCSTFVTVVKRYFKIEAPAESEPKPEPQPHPSLNASPPKLDPGPLPIADALPVRKDGLPHHDIYELGPDDFPSMNGHTHTVTIYLVGADQKTHSYKWAHRGKPTDADIRYYAEQSGK